MHVDGLHRSRLPGHHKLVSTDGSVSRSRVIHITQTDAEDTSPA